jgi:F0F1-type ATP synthase delta subunit
MQNDQIYSEIYYLIHTTADLEYILMELESVEAEIYKNSVLSEFMGSQIRQSTAEVLLKYISGKTNEEIIEILKILRERLNEITVIKLTIAFEPNRDFVMRLKKWFLVNYGEEVLLEINYANNLLAGVIVEHKGKYVNMSLSKHIEKTLSNINLKEVFR